MSKRLTVPEIQLKASRGEKLSALTAYDFTFARIIDEAGVDIILVGDSLGSVIQGDSHTLRVTIEEMTYHTRCVSAGANRALVVSDLPFLTYQLGERDALLAAGKLVQQGGASAVKLEGGKRSAGAISAIVEAGIPVMGHVGLTPQSFHNFGGHKLQGRTERDREIILEDARAVQEAGAFSLVLEGIPAELAAQVTQELQIPTIGIGAGLKCDGQILVCYDLLGLTIREGNKPRFLKEYADLREATKKAVQGYIDEVQGGKFPGPENQF